MTKESRKIYFEEGIAMYDGKPFTGQGKGTRGFTPEEIEQNKERLKSISPEIKIGKVSKKLDILSLMEKHEVEYSYLDGRLHGINRKFYPNGVLKNESNYDKDLLHGTQKSFDENGNLTNELNYLNGKKNGIERFYSNGLITSEGEWLNDQMIRLKCFDEEGKLSMEEEYKDGKIIKDKYYHYENGVRYES